MVVRDDGAICRNGAKQRELRSSSRSKLERGVPPQPIRPEQPIYEKFGTPDGGFTLVRRWCI
jgi:hypothetical protein